MCRSIKQLYNFEPIATEDEVHAAALQYVRKLSGFNAPSVANDAVFNHAVEEIAHASRHLLMGLVTATAPKDRETVALAAKERFAKRNLASNN